MLPLGGTALPSNHDELVTALRAGLARTLRLPADKPDLVVSPGYPALEQLSVDVSGATLPDEFQLTPPLGPWQPAVRVGRLSLVARPLRHCGSDVALALTAEAAELAFRRDGSGRSLLDMVRAGAGRFHALVRLTDLEALLLAKARQSAAAQGVRIDSLRLELSGADGRSAEVKLRVAGRKEMLFAPVQGVVNGRGRLTLDADLNAHLTGLACTGEGLVGSMVAPFVQRWLSQWEGHLLPLTKLSLNHLRLRDLHVHCEGGLHVEAGFGS